MRTMTKPTNIKLIARLLSPSDSESPFDKELSLDVASLLKLLDEDTPLDEVLLSVVD